MWSQIGSHQHVDHGDVGWISWSHFGGVYSAVLVEEFEDKHWIGLVVVRHGEPTSPRGFVGDFDERQSMEIRREFVICSVHRKLTCDGGVRVARYQ